MQTYFRVEHTPIKEEMKKPNKVLLRYKLINVFIGFSVEEISSITSFEDYNKFKAKNHMFYRQNNTN